ncbi:molybdenum-pterin binding domain protein [Microseira wollei NIES-4236]|uniref:Molybdenum-pterin binding domain protein n=1 Tax=Microseira wollei NIES-4236 TaxID=2530354 RepID=A0AAV3WFL4_9CYAN|nr:molybdenum-pterin binding domain protein [Microseira wollei NIES-4236]
MDTRKLTIVLPVIEFNALEEYCRKKGRNKTDVLREFIRSLPPASRSEMGN